MALSAEIREYIDSMTDDELAEALTRQLSVRLRSAAEKEHATRRREAMSNESCDESCHEARRDSCPKCDILHWELMCASCRTYAAQDGFQ